MLIDRWMTADPFKSLDQALDHMFNDVLANRPRRRVGPRLRFRDEGEAFQLAAPFPGVKEEDIELSVGEDFITIKVTREPSVPEGYEVRRRERTELAFERTYRLPDRVDTSKVEAKLDNGVLEVTLPKLAHAQTRTIAVRAA